MSSLIMSKTTAADLTFFFFFLFFLIVITDMPTHELYIRYYTLPSTCSSNILIRGALHILLDKEIS